MTLSNEAAVTWSLVAAGGATPEPFACMLRSTGTLNDDHAGQTLGESEVLNLSTGANARYDLRGAMKQVSLANGVTWPPAGRGFIEINNGTAHNDACISAGAWICTNMTADLNWNQEYQSQNFPRGTVFLRNTPLENILIEGLRAHGGHDGLLLGGDSPGPIRSITLRNSALTLFRDDAIENDNDHDDIEVDNCLLESFVLWSTRGGSSAHATNVSTMRNSIHIPLPSRIENVPNRTQINFKMDGSSSRISLFDNVFSAQDETYSGNGSLFRDLLDNGKLEDSSGNTFCWLGPGSYPHALPPGFTGLEGSAAQNFLDDRVAAFWATFPGHRFNIPGVLVDPGA